RVSEALATPLRTACWMLSGEVPTTSLILYVRSVMSAILRIALMLPAHPDGAPTPSSSGSVGPLAPLAPRPAVGAILRIALMLPAHPDGAPTPSSSGSVGPLAPLAPRPAVGAILRIALMLPAHPD